jgi:hypothetical protein
MYFSVLFTYHIMMNARLYPSQNIRTTVLWTELLAHIGQNRNAFKMLIEEPRGKRPLA